ncbi:helix-turn-helix domain-containing protein [Spirillospora sp. CA-108201]
MDGTERTAPSASQRRLAVELRRLRDLAGLSGREMAHRIGVSQSKVSRIESGLTLPTVPEVTAWSTAVNASPETAALLESLTESAFTEVHRWSRILRDRPHLQGDIQEVESESHRVMVFQNAIIPGLLQTAEYARRVFSFFSPDGSDAGLAAAVAGRLDRQLALFDQTRRFDFLLTEASLRWRPGPAQLLLAQLDRIASLATLDNVTIGLLPHTMEAVTYVTHSFALFDLRDDSRGDGEAIAMVETVHANLTISDSESIARYRHKWRLLEEAALYGDDAHILLDALAGELSAEQR